MRAHLLRAATRGRRLRRGAKLVGRPHHGWCSTARRPYTRCPDGKPQPGLLVRPSVVRIPAGRRTRLRGLPAKVRWPQVRHPIPGPYRFCLNRRLYLQACDQLSRNPSDSAGDLGPTRAPEALAPSPATPSSRHGLEQNVRVRMARASISHTWTRPIALPLDRPKRTGVDCVLETPSSVGRRLALSRRSA
jgi:hypothetical protein